VAVSGQAADDIRADAMRYPGRHLDLSIFSPILR